MQMWCVYICMFINTFVIIKKYIKSQTNEQSNKKCGRIPVNLNWFLEILLKRSAKKIFVDVWKIYLLPYKDFFPPLLKKFLHLKNCELKSHCHIDLQLNICSVV